MRMTTIDKYPVTLQGIDSRFICIPEIIISHPNKKVLVSFVYFTIKAGMDNCIDFSFYSLFNWCLYKPNSHKNITFYQFAEAIQYLIDNNIISYNDISRYNSNISDITFKTTVEMTLNTNTIKQINDDKYFAKIYIDEILDIRDYYKNNSPNNLITTLTVLAFFRLKILFRSDTDTENTNPETYFNYYKNIYTELNICNNIFSKIIGVLSNELHIIYLAHSKYQHRKSTKQHERGNVIVLPTIFCNYYKRKGNKVVNGGIEYCKTETKKTYEKMINKFDIKKAVNLKRDTSLEEADTLSDWVEDTE